MRIKKMVLPVLLVGMLAITGCGNTKDTSITKVEGLEKYGSIAVITREEGSGTRSMFAESLGLINKSQNSTNADLITTNSTVAIDSESVIQNVKENASAIGYVSLGSITVHNDGIKTVKINDMDATSSNVEKGKYSLLRDFNIAYSGKLSDVESDFVNYILSEGQTIVSHNYTAVNKSSSFLSDKSRGTIEIAGSTSVAPLIQELADAYMQINKNAEIIIKTSDSTSGLTAAMQKSCDIGMSSRDLKDFEKELLNYETIAKDGIAVIVNEENPVETLTIDQLSEIFSGTDENWTQINE